MYLCMKISSLAEHITCLSSVTVCRSFVVLIFYSVLNQVCSVTLYMKEIMDIQYFIVWHWLATGTLQYERWACRILNVCALSCASEIITFSWKLHPRAKMISFFVCRVCGWHHSARVNVKTSTEVKSSAHSGTVFWGGNVRLCWRLSIESPQDILKTIL